MYICLIVYFSSFLQVTLRADESATKLKSLDENFESVKKSLAQATVNIEKITKQKETNLKDVNDKLKTGKEYFLFFFLCFLTVLLAALEAKANALKEKQDLERSVAKSEREYVSSKERNEEEMESLKGEAKSLKERLNDAIQEKWALEATLKSQKSSSDTVVQKRESEHDDKNSVFGMSLSTFSFLILFF